MFLDTFAWIEYFEGSRRGAKVKDLLERHAVIYTSPMVLAEIQSKVTRLASPGEADRRVEHVVTNAIVVEHDAELGREAGRIHAALKPTIPGIGLADCFILAAARAKGVRVLTGDPHFKGLPDVDVL